MVAQKQKGHAVVEVVAGDDVAKPSRWHVANTLPAAAVDRGGVTGCDRRGELSAFRLKASALGRSGISCQGSEFAEVAGVVVPGPREVARCRIERPRRRAGRRCSRGLARRAATEQGHNHEHAEPDPQSHPEQSTPYRGWFRTPDLRCQGHGCATRGRGPTDLASERPEVPAEVPDLVGGRSNGATDQCGYLPRSASSGVRSVGRLVGFTDGTRSIGKSRTRPG